MKTIFNSLMLIAVALCFCACTAVDNAGWASVSELQAESSIVFTRPARFTPFFGSYSVSELIEITYERASRNQAGQMMVEVGIRYKGQTGWTDWFRETPRKIALKSICNFYQDGGVDTPVVYATNQRTLLIQRGATYSYKAVCPVKSANRFQLVLGD